MKLKIAIGADHAGFKVKEAMVKSLSQLGHTVVDMGTYSEDSTDYPDYAEKVAKAVSKGLSDRGILACGSGLGMCIAANKVKGIRAATPWSVDVAKLAAQHNWANVLCLPSRFVPISQLKLMVKAWLKTPFDKDQRHARRLKKVRKIESNS